MHKVDSLSSGNRDGYVIEMKSLDNLTIRGYYFVPRTPGKHAALLHVPGYGWGFQNIDPFLKSTENVIELALCVRGHGLSNDVFNPGFDVPGVWGYKLCSKQENAYRGIYMDCVRAVEFLFSRPEVDSTRVGVMGGSQGGGLTLVTAGLCKGKIAACAYFDPFPCDIKDFIDIRTVCKTEIRTFLKFYNNPCSFEDALQVQELINTKGFAQWIQCPVYFATGLFDDDCPPHVGFAAYNLITTEKQYKVFPNGSHMEGSDYNMGFMEFFKNRFKY
jgi:cephalosporin-C deacetylase